jgi:hypothetical protein
VLAALFHLKRHEAMIKLAHYYSKREEASQGLPSLGYKLHEIKANTTFAREALRPHQLQLIYNPNQVFLLV